MHWLKKTVHGAMFALFIFILLMFLEAAGANPVEPSFVTIGGLIVLFAIVISDIHFTTFG
jgi:hypothetical protein